MSNIVAKVADDKKNFRMIKTQDDCEELKVNLHKLSEWTTVWQMRFNDGKCKVMHIGIKKISTPNID